MAARQKATRHRLPDGIVVAWDTSEVDEKLREQLIELADRPLGDIIVGIGTEPRDEAAAPAAPAGRKMRRRRRRSAAA